MPAEDAAARATARDTPRIAFAPRRRLSAVPSSSISRSSKAACSDASTPRKATAIVCSTFATAWSVPRPAYRSASPSRSSSASALPVEAPEGTMARPEAPSPSVTSTSTVGLPRESSTSRARTELMLAMSVGCLARALHALLEKGRMADHRGNLFQAFRPLEKNALGHAPDLLLGFLVLDILDRRLAVDARQHQAAEVPHRHALEVVGCPRFKHESGEQRLPELTGGLDEEFGDRRLMERL